MNHRHMFSIGACDGINCRQLPGAICRKDGGEASDASVSISGITGIELIAAANPFQSCSCQIVQGSQSIVAGNTVNVADAMLAKSGE